MNPDDAWEALNTALEEATPPCKGHGLFTADRLTDKERAHCASICAGCLLVDLCDAYANAARVTSGFWGGAYRRKK